MPAAGSVAATVVFDRVRRDEDFEELDDAFGVPPEAVDEVGDRDPGGGDGD